MKIKVREFDRYCGECNTRVPHFMFQVSSKEFVIECQNCVTRRMALGIPLPQSAGESPLVQE